MSNAIEKWFDRKNLTSFNDLAPLQDSFDRLFNDFMSLRKTNGFQHLSFSPSCEVVDEANNYVLKFDLPGIPKEQVSVQVDRDQITIHAERKEEKKSEAKKKYLSEVYYGSYTRSFTLPGPVDESKVDAKFENGVLTVMVPKTESKNSKRIPIN